MTALQLDGISKQFAENQVLDNISLSIADGEFLSLVGPSGCGKSTLLRIIAGLEQQGAGTIRLGDRDMSGVRAADRNLSMVFQSYALYPHLTVAENIAVPLRMRRLSVGQRLPLLGGFLPGARALNKQIARDVYNTAAVLEIDPLLDRKPGQLSGGQRQRVALGRAIVRDPSAFLFDEPLSNLDAKLRVQTRSEIAELHRRLGATFVYVTHDQVEAMTMSGRIAVMMDGRILQCASPDKIYNDPEDIRVAEFIGSPKINILSAYINDNGLRVHDVLLPLQDMTSGERQLKIGIRPEALYLAGSDGKLAGRVGHLENLGSEVFLHVDAAVSNERIVVKASPDQSRHLSVGSPVMLNFDARTLLIFDSRGKRQRSIESALAPRREVA